MPFGKRKKKYFRRFSQLSIVPIQNISSGNLKFNNLDIFQSLKYRILAAKILPISIKLKFTPCLACYGLTL